MMPIPSLRCARAPSSTARPPAAGALRSLTLAALAALTAGLLAACSTAALNKPPRVAPTIEQPGREVVTLANAESGTTVLLARPQVLVVRLLLEHADSTAGLDWALVGGSRGVVVGGAPSFEHPVRQTDGDDAGGTVVWRFTTQAPGSVSLQFDLRRPHSLDPASRSLTYSVTVK
jgi:predicted secreted protein